MPAAMTTGPLAQDRLEQPGRKRMVRCRCYCSNYLDTCVGGEALSGGKYKRFRGVLKSLKRLLKKCAEFPNVYFSLGMPSSCSCWSWPELHALISSSKVKRVKVADQVDATGRLIGRRTVLSNMSDVECLEANFLGHVKRKLKCSLFQCIDSTWRSFADHVRSLVHAHVRTGSVIRDTGDSAWESDSFSVFPETPLLEQNKA